MRIIDVPSLGSAEVEELVERLEQELRTKVDMVVCSPSSYCIFKGQTWDIETAHWVMPDEVWVEMENGEYILIRERRDVAE